MNRPIRAKFYERLTGRQPMIINNRELVQIITRGMTDVTTTPHNYLPIDRSANAQKAALVLGGSENVFTEFYKAKELCDQAHRDTIIIACNDMIAQCPEPIDHAVTLHPEFFHLWFKARQDAGFPPLTRIWSHRSYVGFTDHTKDWIGSTGLLALKIAREIACTHIILCGVPMTCEDDHFVRHRRWQAAHGFRRGWGRHVHLLKPFTRSMSGWTREQFGFPDYMWLTKTIDDPYPCFPQPVGVKA
jgi:hypothetical protein